MGPNGIAASHGPHDIPGEGSVLDRQPIKALLQQEAMSPKAQGAPGVPHKRWHVRHTFQVGLKR